jgi:hypothetical protein
MMVEGFPDLPTNYFGKLTSYTFALISHIIDPLHKLGVSLSSTLIHRDVPFKYYYRTTMCDSVR